MLATEIGGKKVTKIVDNSIFMNLDDIKCMDGIGAFLIGNTKVTILPEIIVCTESKVAVKAGEGIESGAFLNLQIIDESADTSAKTVTRKPAANTVPTVQSRFIKR